MKKIILIIGLVLVFISCGKEEEVKENLLKEENQENIQKIKPNWVGKTQNHHPTFQELAQGKTPVGKSMQGLMYWKDDQGVYILRRSTKAIDEMTTFWLDELPDVDPTSFEFVDIQGEALWGKDKNNVYFWHEIIDEADPKTFEIIGSCYGGNYQFYTKDSQNVYEKLSKVQKADPKTFEIINLRDCLTKDKNNFYFNSFFLEGGEKVNRETFQCLGSNYFKDKNYIYYYKALAGGLNIMTEADYKTFVLFKKKPFYAKDKNNVYLHGNIILEADSETFENINFGYNKDKNYIYWHDSVLKKINPKTFKIINYNFARDDQYALSSGKILEGIDPNNFDAKIWEANYKEQIFIAKKKCEKDSDCILNNGSSACFNYYIANDYRDIYGNIQCKCQNNLCQKETTSPLENYKIKTIEKLNQAEFWVENGNEKYFLDKFDVYYSNLPEIIFSPDEKYLVITNLNYDLREAFLYKNQEGKFEKINLNLAEKILEIYKKDHKQEWEIKKVDIRYCDWSKDSKTLDIGLRFYGGGFENRRIDFTYDLEINNFLNNL